MWSITSRNEGVVIGGATVSSAELAAGQWNWIPLPQAVPIAIGSPYIATIAVNGAFPNTNNEFGTADPYGEGIVNGPLTAYSDQSGSLQAPYGLGQGGFTTSGSDPTTNIPNGTSGSANFWVDVQVSDAVPAGYSGSYRLWPNKWDANPQTSADAPVNYAVATEIGLTETCVLQRVWYYSPASSGQLATRCDVYDTATQESVASITVPSWSGPAGSGWVWAAFSDQVAIPAGRYKVAVFNGSANPDGWSAKDASTMYWDTGVGAIGITNGPLYAPGLAAASSAYVYDGDGADNDPRFSNGSGKQEPGQGTFAVGGPQYPYLYGDGLAQNYWVDVEVTPGDVASPPPTNPPSVNPSAFLAFIN